jgi:ATP-dependent DNA helicase RecG
MSPSICRPAGSIDDAIEELEEQHSRQIVTITLTPTDYRQGGARGPFRVHATDGHGDVVSLIYFGGNPGWAKKLLPLGEPRIVSGKLESYGQELQIVHPDHVLPLAEAAVLAEREPVYPLSEGIDGRLSQLAEQALARAPDLPEWIEPSVLEKHGWPGWRDALTRLHADPSDAKARERLAYDEIFANQLALMLVRASARRRRGRALHGDGRLRAMLKLPYSPTGAQQRTIGEIEGDMAQERPMLRLLQGDVGSGKTLVALMSLLTAVEAGAQGAMLAPTEILARQHFETISKQLAGAARDGGGADRSRQGQGARIDADGAGRRIDRHIDRHACDLPGGGDLQGSGACRGRRAASLRRRAAAAAPQKAQRRRICW